MPAPHRELRNSDRKQTILDLRPNSLAKTPRIPMLLPSSPSPQRPDPLHLAHRRKAISPRALPFLLKANPAFSAVNLRRTKIIMAALAERQKAPVALLLEISQVETRWP